MTVDPYPIGPFEPTPTIPSGERRAALIARVAALPDRLRAAVAGLDEERLDAPYRDGGWSPRQIVHHLADAHMSAFVHLRLALTEERPTLRPYDQDAWAELPDVRGVPIEPSLRLLEGLHERWTRLVEGMDDAAYARTVEHPVRGTLDLGFLLQLYAWHGDHHTAQIERLRERVGW